MNCDIVASESTCRSCLACRGESPWSVDSQVASSGRKGQAAVTAAAWEAGTRERFPYEIVSHWRVPGPIGRVYELLSDSAALPRWWPQAYHRVREIAPGDADGRGRVLEITTKGALPYALAWRLEILEATRPRLIRLRASGELVGFGEWQLSEAANEVTLVYTWRVRAEHPILRRLEFVLKPIFALNHNWVMRKGEAGLKRELARRAA
jgi:uncharacterized protein YndB with AHSA1/START domain